jgi:hypothetical protein
LKITYAEKETPSLEIGDLIEFNGNVYLLVKAKHADTGIELISLNEAIVYKHDTFAHPVHIINHIRKHYKDNYVIIKQDRVELNIQE